jgi:Hemerythrin HHE cation binding domain
LVPRHPAVIPLSRDHQDALTLAFRLLHPAPPGPVTAVTPESTLAGRVTWVVGFFEHSLLAHFEEEERVVFPEIRRHRSAGAGLLDTLEAEHVRLVELRDGVRGAIDDAARHSSLQA